MLSGLWKLPAWAKYLPTAGKFAKHWDRKEARQIVFWPLKKLP
jgi:hypothetical protein